MRTTRTWATLGAAWILGCGTPVSPTPEGLGPVSGTTATPPCAPEEVLPAGLAQAGQVGDREALLANGRRVTPAGDLFWGGRYPIGAVVNATGTRAYLTHNDDFSRALQVLDLTATDPTKQRLQTLPIGSVFRGVALSPDGATLWVGGGAAGLLRVYDVGPDGLLAEAGTVPLTGYLADLVLSPDGGRVYVASNTNSRIFVVDTATRQVVATWRAGTFPYDLVVSPDGTRLYVSNLGASNVQVLDTASGATAGVVTTGKNPEGMAISPDGSTLYVVNSDSDSLTVIETATLAVRNVVDLSGNPMLWKHGNLNTVALSPDGTRLFVSQASLDKVDVIETATGKVLGSIPTGWYPTEVLARPEALYVLSSKGLGMPDPRQLKNFPGFLARVPYPDDPTLAAMSAQVDGNNARTGYFADTCTPEAVKVLSGPGTSPIQHVVLIVRENKTYDMLLGDFERGDGDPALVVFGEHYTPNLHKLAREFINMDNFYSNPEVSIQGHQWTTQATCNDYTEKLWPDQLPIAGLEASSLPEGDAANIFDNCWTHGVSFRNYGEFPGFAPYMFDRYRFEFDNKYPFWTTDVKDVDKAAEVVREWKLGIFPQFVYIGLPNDHTAGGKAGKPTPESMVADNDRATAMLIEELSQLPEWSSTAVFIIEDDPQGSGDHVEAHRSICIVVSPWVRRGYTSSVHYDIPSMYRTIELILGLPPMGKNDAFAPPMLDIWVDGVTEPPDNTAFVGVPVDVPDGINPKGTLADELSSGCDFDDVDECPGLGRVLWLMMRGDVEPPPYARGIDR